MAVYAKKICIVCGCAYFPLSPNQKLCESNGCFVVNRRKVEALRREKKRKYESHECPSCKKVFLSSDPKMVYCGSAECEKFRCLKKARIGYRRHRHSILKSKRDYYISNKVDFRNKGKRYYRQVTRKGQKVRDGHSTEKPSFLFVQRVFEDEGYTLLSNKYENNNTKIDVECTNGHLWSTTYHSFKDAGNRCQQCYLEEGTHRSGPEQEIYEMLCDVLGTDNVIHNDRSVLSPKELDIYIPEKNFAIEFCGLYWHSQVSGNKEPRYHYDKQKACNDKGIRLMTIFEDEYRDRKDVVISRIKNAIGAYKRRVFARKCKFGVPMKSMCTDMMKEHHLQGNIGSKYQFGLFYEDELIQAMTFGSLSRTHCAKGYGRMMEMKRMVTVPGISIPGGASKLFKHSCDILRAEGYQTIKSYCDTRYGAITPIYETLGFQLVGMTKWTPHYQKDGRRVRNQGLRKTVAEKLTGRTEWDLRREQGYDRIFDCGHKTYVYYLVDKSEVF